MESSVHWKVKTMETLSQVQRFGVSQCIWYVIDMSFTKDYSEFCGSAKGDRCIWFL